MKSLTNHTANNYQKTLSFHPCLFLSHCSITWQFRVKSYLKQKVIEQWQFRIAHGVGFAYCNIFMDLCHCMCHPQRIPVSFAAYKLQLLQKHSLVNNPILLFYFRHKLPDASAGVRAKLEIPWGEIWRKQEQISEEWVHSYQCIDFIELRG